LKNELSLALCGIRDPGNMGSIIRAADWFGINNVVCSPDTCDIYNPKAVSAAMGSAFRVKVHYTELAGFLAEAKETGAPVYASVIDGENIYGAKLAARGIIIIGNESKGVPEEITALAEAKISIPSFGGAESLNAALAAAVIFAEFRRRTA
jgi:TrmH family RNA methyltransferase